jgi:hypothetical protein
LRPSASKAARATRKPTIAKVIAIGACETAIQNRSDEAAGKSSTRMAITAESSEERERRRSSR